MKNPVRKWLVLLPLLVTLLGVLLVARFTARATPATGPLANPPWATNVRVNVMPAGTSLQDTLPALAASRATSDLYAAWPSYSNTGYADVYLARSINGGTTWGTPHPINAADHWIDASAGEAPAIAVSGSLTIHAVWRGTPSMYLETLFYNRSIDGGQTWGTDRNLIQSQHYSSGGIGTPDLAADQTGRVYVAWATTAAFPVNYLGLARSSDAGVSWITSTAAIITSALGVGNPVLAVDVTSTLHLAWEEITSAWPDPNGRATCYARSANSGQTWTNRQCIGGAPTTTTLQINPDVAVDPFNGRVHVVWQDDRSGAYQIYHVSSSNGGISWGTPTLVSGVFTPTTEPAISVVAEGVVYVVWQDGHNGNDDIYYTRSTDGGQTWSAAGRVNDDSEVRASPQRHPVIVSATDGPRVAWNDFRTVQADIYATSLVSMCAVPLTGLRVSGSSTITPDTPLALSAIITPSNATLPVSYNWSPVPVSGQGTAQASYTWSMPGHYTVTAGASNCGGTFSAEQGIEVLCLAPLTAASIQGPTVITAGTPVVFNAIVTPTTPSSPVIYAWSPAPISGQGTWQAHYLWQDVGTRSVAFTATNCGGTFAVSQNVMVRDDLSPTYASFVPSGWVTTTQTPDVRVQVMDAESGLNVSSGQYATSIDGGANWSSWLSATVSGANFVTTPQTLTVNVLPFGHDTDVTHQYRVHFRISDMAGHLSASSNYAVNIDTAPPTNPAVVINGSPSSWINRASVAVTLTGATDPASGVAGYLTYWNQSASTVPGPGLSGAVWTAATNFSSTVPGDGKDWYLHVRSQDTAGNWASGATHVGPYWFDITPPTAVTYYTSTPAQGALWHHNTIYVRWSGGTDYGSGLGGYAYLWDTAPTSTPDPITQTLGTSTISPALPDTTYYFHIRARDKAGNWTPPAHFGPFKLDSTPPTAPAIVSSNPGLNVWTTDNTLAVTWAASYDAGGISGYAYQWDNWPSMTPNWITQTAGLTATSAPLGDGKQYFHIAARDLAGQWSPVTHYGPVKVDANPPTNPTLHSTSHSSNAWSDHRVMTETWYGATDGLGSGVYGYSYLWDNVSSTVPDTTVDTASTSASQLFNDGTWYFHLRTRDVAGQWSASAVHDGPFMIDGTPPTNPTSFTSTPTPGVWTTNPSVIVNWGGAADGAGSGVDGYSIEWSHSPNTLPDALWDTSNTSTTKDLYSGNDWYLHVRTRDKMFNWSSTAAHYGPFYIDYSTPHCTAVSPASSPSRTFTVSWSGQSAWSGVAGFDVAYRDATAGSDWQIWQANVTFPSAAFTGLDGHVYEFRCRARSNSGVVENWPSTYQTRTGVATVDFEVIGLEVTQGIQDMTNSVPLVADKRTFARFHVRVTSPWEASAALPVTARLYVWKQGVYVGVLSPSNSGEALYLVPDPDRGSLNDSYYFEVPTDWLGYGTVDLVATVDPDQVFAESTSANNTAQAHFTMRNPYALCVHVVPIATTNPPGAYYTVNSPDFLDMIALLQRFYPLADSGVRIYTGQGIMPGKSGKTWNLNDKDTWSTILNAVADYSSHWSDPPGCLRLNYYGMLMPVPALYNGLGQIPGNAAIGRMIPGEPRWPPPSGGQTMAHEIGHNYSRPHVACNGEDGTDPGYPYPGTNPCRIANDTPQSYYGFFLPIAATTPEVITPTGAADLMSYGDRRWISDYTYRALLSLMGGGSSTGPTALAAVTAPTGEYVYAIGTITPTDSTATLGYFYRTAEPKPSLAQSSLESTLNITAPYSLTLENASGATLLAYPFQPPAVEGDEGAITNTVSFELLLSWHPDTARISVYLNGIKLATRLVSANPPTVNLLSPAGGEVITDTLTVTWQVDDADLDELHYVVRYSPDNGATWQPLATDLSTTTLTVTDLTWVPGSNQARVQVLASDGVNTGQATSASFSLSKHAPLAHIMEPSTGSIYRVQQPVVLRGVALDAEDGNILSPAQIVWTSNLSGTLGTGPELWLTTLPVGTHRITLTVTDSDQQITTDHITVTIGQRVYLPIVLRQ
jgi:hypothetical protein